MSRSTWLVEPESGQLTRIAMGDMLWQLPCFHYSLSMLNLSSSVSSAVCQYFVNTSWLGVIYICQVISGYERERVGYTSQTQWLDDTSEAISVWMTHLRPFLFRWHIQDRFCFDNTSEAFVIWMTHLRTLLFGWHTWGLCCLGDTSEVIAVWVTHLRSLLFGWHMRHLLLGWVQTCTGIQLLCFKVQSGKKSGKLFSTCWLEPYIEGEPCHLTCLPSGSRVSATSVEQLSVDLWGIFCEKYKWIRLLLSWQPCLWNAVYGLGLGSVYSWRLACSTNSTTWHCAASALSAGATNNCSIASSGG